MPIISADVNNYFRFCQHFICGKKIEARHKKYVDTPGTVWQGG